MSVLTVALIDTIEGCSLYLSMMSDSVSEFKVDDPGMVGISRLSVILL